MAGAGGTPALDAGLPECIRARFDAALFDMDGLLIDSEPYWKRAEREAFAEVGIEITEAMAMISASMSPAEVAAHWFRHKPWEGRAQADLVEAVVSRVAAHVSSHGTARAGVREALSHCATMGWKAALVSNSPLALCRHTTRTLGIADAFCAMFSAEQVERGKPEPDVYLHAARNLGVEPARCLVFEDSVGGVQAAVRAGMTVVAVPSAGQMFHDVSHPPHCVVSTLADFCRLHRAWANPA
jgi:sugar-phosphatase